MSINKNKIIIEDVMLKINEIPTVDEKLILRETLEHMNLYKLGIACIVDSTNTLKGVFTDGDFRRLLLKYQGPLSRLFMEDTINVSRKEFISINPFDNINSALKLMETKKIWDLPVIDNNSKLIGLVHLHPVVKALTS